MTDLRAQFILTFEDKVTAGLRKLQEQLRGLRNAGGALGGGALKQATEHATRFGRALTMIGRAARGAAGHLGGMLKSAERLGQRGGAIGALVGFATLKETTQTYADYDAVLRQIAIVEGRSGGGRARATSARLGGRFDTLALKTGQSSTDIAEAYKWIITTHPGVTAKAARAMANQMIGPLAHAATAYHLHVTDLANVPQALQRGFRLRGDQMETGLAILHKAAMQAHFTMAAFDQELSGMAAQLGSLGVTGLKGLRQVSAMLETVVQGVPSAQKQRAATDLGDLLTYITNKTGQGQLAMTSRGFSGKMYANTLAMLRRAGITHGLNVPALLSAAAKVGIDPIDAVMMWLHQKLAAIPKNITGQDRQLLKGEVVNAFFNNREAAQAVRMLLLHWNDYHRNLKAVQNANAGGLHKNFRTMKNSPLFQFQQMGEESRQLGRALGKGFMPVLTAVNHALGALVAVLKWANTHFPRTTAWVLGLAGAGIALVAALGALGFIAPAVAAGFVLLLDVLGALAGAAAVVAGPFAAVAIVIGAAAYDIYAHWARFKPFFAGMFGGLLTMLDGIGNVLKGIFLFNWHTVAKGIGQIAHGFVQAWASEIDILKTLLMDLIKWLTGWSDKDLARIGKRIEADVTAPFHAVAHFFAGMKPSAASATGVNQSAAGGAGGGMSYLMPVVTVKVGVDPHNGKIAITHTSAPSVVRLQPLDMGDRTRLPGPGS